MLNDKIVVVIGDDPIEERKGEFTDEATGKAVKYDTRKQPAKIEAGGYAYPGKIPLEKGQPAYAVGRYVMRTDKMLTVDNNGKIGFKKFPVLTPETAGKP